jgi:hypothetical protein
MIAIDAGQISIAYGLGGPTLTRAWQISHGLSLPIIVIGVDRLLFWIIAKEHLTLGALWYEDHYGREDVRNITDALC